MLITKETDYALRILRALADRERHAMRDLCEEQDVPQQFGYKIIRKLAASGIIESTRGANGGCRLRSDLKTFTLLDLIRTIDPERLVSACISPNYHCSWREKNCDHCAMHTQLAMIQRNIDRELKKHTLHDMLYGPMGNN